MAKRTSLEVRKHCVAVRSEAAEGRMGKHPVAPRRRFKKENLSLATRPSYTKLYIILREGDFAHNKKEKIGKVLLNFPYISAIYVDLEFYRDNQGLSMIKT